MLGKRWFEGFTWVLILLSFGCANHQSDPRLVTVKGNEHKRGTEKERPASINIDSWFREPPSFWMTNAVRIEYSLVHAVIPAQQAFAQAKLKDKAFQSLSSEEASTLIGGPVANNEGLQNYLLRAVYLIEPAGFSVYLRGSEILASHECLGRHPLPMRRMALVVQLAQAPSNVFATCSMAE